MFTEYISEVKESALKGVFVLSKRAYKFQLLAYFVLFILVILFMFLVAGSFFASFVGVSQNPTNFMQNQELMQTLFQENAGWFALAIPIFLLIGAWYYTVVLNVNENIVKTERGNLGDALKKSFSIQTLRMFVYFLIQIGLYLFSALIIVFLASILGKVGSALGILIAFVGVIAFILAFSSKVVPVSGGEKKFGSSEAANKLTPFSARRFLNSESLFLFVVATQTSI